MRTPGPTGASFLQLAAFSRVASEICLSIRAGNGSDLTNLPLPVPYCSFNFPFNAAILSAGTLNSFRSYVISPFNSNSTSVSCV